MKDKQISNLNEALDKLRKKHTKEIIELHVLFF